MNTVEQQLRNAPRHYRYILTISVIVIAVLIWSLTAMNFKDIDTKGLNIMVNILNGIVHPDTNLLFNFGTQGILYLILQTLAIAFLGTFVGAVLSIPMAFLAASNIVPKPVPWLTRILLIVIRTIPFIVYGLMFVRVTGPGPFAGVLTVGLISVGMLSRLYVDAIEEINTNVLESMTSIGCSTFEKIRYGIMPQLLSIFMSVTIYRFDMNLRDASVLGLVGAGGIGAPLIFAMKSYEWHQVGAILIGLIVLILIIEFISNKLRSRLVNG